MYRDPLRLLESELDSEDENKNSNEANGLINLFDKFTAVFDLSALELFQCVLSGALAVTQVRKISVRKTSSTRIR